MSIPPHQFNSAFLIVFYFFLKIYARLAIRLYCKKIVVNKPYILHQKGPLLFAANHPNSFLDGIILTTLLDAPLYSLARGDAFKNKGLAAILKKLRLLPVYRHSEGAENLNQNYHTFSACHEVFKKGAAVLIFSEAQSCNEWHLRPLRKGTARLAISSWQQGIQVPVIPLGFNYDSFKHFGKTVHINFGEEILSSSVEPQKNYGQQLSSFNEKVYAQLQTLVYEAQNKQEAGRYFPVSSNLVNTILCIGPAVLGWLLHAPLFYTCLLVTQWRFRNSDHYDSVLHSLLLIAYPFYILLSIGLLWQLVGAWAFLAFFFLPFTAWCWLQLKEVFSR